MLRGGELCVCHIENALGKRQPYISQQLMVLRDAGAVESRKDGLQVYYRIVDERVQHLLDAALGEADAISFAPCRAAPARRVLPLNLIQIN